MRAAQIKKVVVPMTIMSIVVGFLLIMVAVGLFGVLWQNISGRTQEIGLRRALGASAASVRSQIIGELVLLALLFYLLIIVIILSCL